MENSEVKVYVAANEVTRQIKMFSSQEEAEQGWFQIFAVIHREETKKLVKEIIHRCIEEKRAPFDYTRKVIYSVVSREEDTNLLKAFTKASLRLLGRVIVCNHKEDLEISEVAIEKTNAATF